ncbi:nicotinamide mononucleotide transporter family protein [Herbidospora mongoliensis]|uniref:nicotinamide mononucleotide transporter family protein n=1 Tax=Herbidospora mongoliensis TaxID=688067 RepID=UPI00083583F0|nr:nicotinamide mononucleotide transporter family protein [Herbidospora mongoliensis]
MNASFEVFGTTVLWTDLIGNILALATVVFAIRRSLWTWPVQLTASVLLLAASINAGLTGNALKQVLFGVLAIYGWVRWKSQGEQLDVRPATYAERLFLAGTVVVGTALVGWFFFVTGLSWGAHAPLPEGYFLVAADAYIFVGSAVATWAQGRALTDFWLVWIAVDLVGVPLAFRSGLVVSGAVYAVFFVLVLTGFVNWRKQWQQKEAVAV